MKYLSKLTRILVDFIPGEGPKPAFFILDGKRVKVDGVVSKISIRKTFDNCVLYKCKIQRKFVELLWDRDKDLWFIERIGE